MYDPSDLLLPGPAASREPVVVRRWLHYVRSSLGPNMVIGIDFDGTCTTHEFPAIGRDIGAVPVLKELVAAGHLLILWTMRCDTPELPGANFLQQAVDWFTRNDIPLFGVQKNPVQDSWTTSPKAYCHVYIDDAALGCPLILNGDRPYVDWVAVRELLVLRGIL